MRKKIKNHPITCRPFEKLTDAKSDAMLRSGDDRNTQYIILTGDLFFVSTTADIQPYEKLITKYEKGVQVDIKQDEKINAKIGFQQYNNKYKTISSLM